MSYIALCRISHVIYDVDDTEKSISPSHLSAIYFQMMIHHCHQIKIIITVIDCDKLPPLLTLAPKDALSRDNGRRKSFAALVLNGSVLCKKFYHYEVTNWF